jgi:uncharacterized protein YutE (UPF0331/DUF86 family)
VDPLILAEKLEALRRCVKRVEERRAPSADMLRADIDRQDILALNLTRAVQLCVDIASHVLTDTEQAAPQTMGEAFDLLAKEGVIPEALGKRLRGAVGFRNVAVHSYDAINWDIVHVISHEGLEDFRSFAAAIAALLRKRTPNLP